MFVTFLLRAEKGTSAACWTVYEIAGDKTLRFAPLKPEKCTMCVTFLLRASVIKVRENDQS